MALLTAYKLGSPGQTLGVDIVSWISADLSGNSPFKTEDSVSAGYADISSIENWDKFGDLVGDYIFVKDKIKDIVNVSPPVWGSLSNAEKDIAIEYYCHDSDSDKVTYLITVKGMSQSEAEGFLLDSWHGHFQKLVLTSQPRWTATIKETLKYLTIADAADLFETVEQIVYYHNTTGRLGLNYGDNGDGVMDYIESTNGYAGTGLEYNSYNLLTGSPNDWEGFKDALTDILVNGNYDRNTIIY